MNLLETSTAEFKPTADLTPDEQHAVASYQSDSTFFHALAQGWGPELEGHPKFAEAARNCSRHGPALERAITKFMVTKAGSVWSAHANGTASLGAVRGDVGKLVGMRYRYGGFISCSNMLTSANGFFDNKRPVVAQPVMLIIELAVGMDALPMHEVTESVGEGEILMGRSVDFVIASAEWKHHAWLQDGVVWLTLRHV